MRKTKYKTADLLLLEFEESLGQNEVKANEGKALKV